jgi:hypothetical protein
VEKSGTRRVEKRGEEMDGEWGRRRRVERSGVRRVEKRG